MQPCFDHIKRCCMSDLRRQYNVMKDNNNKNNSNNNNNNNNSNNSNNNSNNNSSNKSSNNKSSSSINRPTTTTTTSIPPTPTPTPASLDLDLAQLCSLCLLAAFATVEGCRAAVLAVVLRGVAVCGNALGTCADYVGITRSVGGNTTLSTSSSSRPPTLSHQPSWHHQHTHTHTHTHAHTHTSIIALRSAQGVFLRVFRALCTRHPLELAQHTPLLSSYLHVFAALPASELSTTLLPVAAVCGASHGLFGCYLGTARKLLLHQDQAKKCFAIHSLVHLLPFVPDRTQFEVVSQLYIYIYIIFF